MDISYILNNKEKYVKCLNDRYMDTAVIEIISVLHDSYVKELFIRENLQKLQNIVSKQIKKINDPNKLEIDNESNKIINVESLDDEQLLDLFKSVNYSLDSFQLQSKDEVLNLAQRIKKLIKIKEEKTDNLFKTRNNLVSNIPNILHPNVPISESEENNIILFCNSSQQTKKFDQYELCCKLQIVEDGSDISGNRGYFLVKEGVRLNYALLNYALDFLEQKKYKLMTTPHFIAEKHIKNICQLADFADTLYSVCESKDDYAQNYLIATSEQPITAYFTQKKLMDLPIKIGGISSCYRREAGRSGKDTLGIFRVHQFEKVEQFCVTELEQSWEMMENMMETSKEFYDCLGLTYRVVNIVSKELNNAASMKYDLEGWFPGSNKFRELVSCSNTTDYFSKRIKTKDSKGRFVHLLNSTLCANTRTICCLLETYQTDDGVIIPEVLKKYYPVDKIFFKK